jgi:Transposase DDE domain group 1
LPAWWILKDEVPSDLGDLACRESETPIKEGTYQMQVTRTRPKITATADGRGVVGHAGTRLLADVADVTGLTGAFGDALAMLRHRDRGHDPGRIAVDLAVMLADGGEAIADLAMLRNQVELFGPVASDPTAWRLLSNLDDAALPSPEHDAKPPATPSPTRQAPPAPRSRAEGFPGRHRLQPNTKPQILRPAPTVP